MPVPKVAHGPTMLFTSVSPAVTVPDPGILRVAPGLRVNVPVLSVRVRPVATFHVWPLLPRSVSPELTVRFWVAALMSMPDEPRVSVLPGPMVTAAPGLVIVIPFQPRSAPRSTEFEPVTIELHVATSAAVGSTAPLQLEVMLRLLALLAFWRVAACAEYASPATESPTMMGPR